MKKIFTLFAVALSLGFTASAQSDLQMITSLKAVDTVRFKLDGSVGKIILYSFINHGPNALISTDTIVWRGPVFGQVSLSLPPAGVPANDTVYYLDTLFLNAMPPAPVTNPFNWCDSIWAKHTGGAIIADPNVANNKTCKSVRFIQLNSGVGVGNVAGELKQELSVYPNPATGSINFSFAFGNNVAASVAVRDLLGKTVMQKDLGKGISGKQSYSLDISNLQNGIYFLELSHNGSKAISRVVVQK